MRRYFVMPTNNKGGHFKPKPAPYTPKAAGTQGEVYAGVADHMTIGDKPYRLVFDNMTFVLIENVYRERYGRVAGLPQVLAELEAIGYAATMAVFYAAMERAATLDGTLEDLPDWETYVADFKLAQLPGVAQKLREMNQRAMPDPEAYEKNA